jgi:dTDP-4-dehydrorhamnose reductase
VRILLFGSSGQVGHALQQDLPALGAVIALTRQDVDFEDPESLRGVMRRHSPDIVVNAAAYTAVDKAESERDRAERINSDAPRILAEEAHALGACLVHYSTDYVFDGTKTAPYVESDEPNPQSVYGRTKLAGEVAVRQRCARSLVFRTSWVFSEHGHNFLKTILRLARERDRLQIVADQVGAPTSAAEISRVTLHVLKTVHAAAPASPWGVYHVAAAGETSWFGYARHVIAQARQLGTELKIDPDHVTPISTAQYPAAARRPASSRLDTGGLRRAFGVSLPSWQFEVDRVVRSITSGTS